MPPGRVPPDLESPEEKTSQKKEKRKDRDYAPVVIGYRRDQRPGGIPYAGPDLAESPGDRPAPARGKHVGKGLADVLQQREPGPGILPRGETQRLRRAGSRVERYPAVYGEIDLDPGVGVAGRYLVVAGQRLSLIHISEPTRLGMISYAVFCLKKK